MTIIFLKACTNLYSYAEYIKQIFATHFANADYYQSLIFFKMKRKLLFTYGWYWEKDKSVMLYLKNVIASAIALTGLDKPNIS